MNIQQATRAYESWLSGRMPLISADLKVKHARMRESIFAFLRATFYRWVELWPQVCPELQRAPTVLAVGDLHVENFGTWRDAEGRLVWGVNDFDEACQLSYASDLVRLAVSAQLATKENQLSCSVAEICDAIADGYREALERGGRAFVLAEHHSWLRQLAISDLRDPIHFWQKLQDLPTIVRDIPSTVRRQLQALLPAKDIHFRIVHRQAGLGSLGRRRFTALAEWRGGLIAREAKELTSSAFNWRRAGSSRILYRQIIGQAVRVADPFLQIAQPWLLRRLAPDCSRIPLASLPKQKDEISLLRVMGWETANIHLGTKGAGKKILQDLRKRPAKWLRETTAAMAQSTEEDWKSWRTG